MKRAIIKSFTANFKNHSFKFLLIIQAVLFILQSCTNQQELGIFEQSADVGQPKIEGSSVYDIESGEYLLSGAGENIWYKRDEFHFLYKEIEGDFILRARVKFRSEERRVGKESKYKMC